MVRANERGFRRPSGFGSALSWMTFALLSAVPLGARAETPDIVRSAIPAIGVYGKSNSAFWIDANADKQPDLFQVFGLVGVQGLLADITGSGTRVPGIFKDGVWYFDFDRDGVQDKTISFGQSGDIPLVADMDNDGKDDLVLFRNGTWLVSTTGDGALSYTYSFSGQRAADIVWRETASGNFGFSYMSGSSSNWVFAANASTGWNVVGTGDFNGDGRADLLWREIATGNLGINYVNGASLSWAPVGPSSTAYQAAGIGDFDKDGRDDILWRETATGFVGIYFMNGATATWTSVGPASTAWQIVGVGDFNGDGRTDILWRETATGTVGIWFMNGATPTWALVGATSPAWEVAGVADLNGDRRSDVVWRETATGNLGAWFMNGAAATWASIGGAPTAWQIRGIRDFDGDGRADILWRETATGNVAIWFMNGTAPTGTYVSTFPTTWEIQAVGDFGPSSGTIPLLGDVDGDGIVDLIVYDTGKWYVSANRTNLVGAMHSHGGQPTDVPIVLDYDGDGVDDLAVVRGPTWDIKSVRPGGFVGTYNLGVGAVGDTPLYWGNGQVANARLEAARFLARATFGPTEADISAVLQWGNASWIAQQFAVPPSRYSVMAWWPQNSPSPPTGTTWPTCTNAMYTSGVPYNASTPCNCQVGSGTDQCLRDVYSNFQVQRQFFANALTAPDQLRQRVAWALSQILVTSSLQDPIAYPMRDYQQLLVDSAFGKFENLLMAVTLSPWMGNYLDMVNNSRTIGTSTLVPNENYARELMQLFSIGLWKLNMDGTLMLDGGGNPIPTYDQTDITELARMLTGWTYAPLPGTTARWNPGTNYVGNMIPIEGALTGTGTTNYHDTNAKTVLGTPVPAGTRAAADVALAVQLVANHPNTAPFMSKQLIQFLVTSNPSPNYVLRVANVWANNGSGIRGDLGAVVKAILLDPEALAPENPIASSFGKLKEPVLAITSFLRQMGGTSDGVSLRGATATTAMGQSVFNSPTVFNYYSADYMIPGTGLAAPQFNIFDATLYFARTNYFYNLIFSTTCDASSTICGPAPDTTVMGSTGTKVNYSALKALAQDPAALVSAVDNMLLYGTMSKAMRLSIIQAVNAVALSVPATQAQLLDRARAAVYLTVVSPKFQVEH